jgi:hypothetical protein
MIQKNLVPQPLRHAITQISRSVAKMSEKDDPKTLVPQSQNNNDVTSQNPWVNH